MIMSNFTNSGLVEYCKTALTKNTAYMWGGLFRTITTDYINQLKKFIPMNMCSLIWAYFKIWLEKDIMDVTVSV